MNIAVVGTGYVGLVTGTCFAEMGNHVICVDIDKSKVERMRQGEIQKLKFLNVMQSQHMCFINTHWC